MRKGRKFPVTVGTLIAAAFPKHAAKHLETELGCTSRQAWRMVSTGKVPDTLRGAVIDLLKTAIEARKTQLQRVEDEIKQIEYQEMVARAAARRAEGDTSAAATVAGQGVRQ